MQAILHSYKLRLTNISQGNRTLKLGKLSPRRDIDLFDLGHLESDSPEDLFQKILAGKTTPLLKKLDARMEKNNLVDKRLSHIYREAQAIQEETGAYDLFLGYPFVEGKFAEGTSVRCPLFLFPVRLQRSLSGKVRWQLEPQEEGEIFVNTTFFLAYEQYQQTRMKASFWEEIWEYQDDWQAWLNQVYEKLMKEYALEVNFNSDTFERKIQPFSDVVKEVMDKWPVGVLKLMPNAVLGIFPQSDSALLQDYETLERNPELFPSDKIFSSTPFEMQTKAQKADFSLEKDRFFVTELDHSQENTLLQIEAGKSLIVHGPPGTGKSQVIVNAISNALAKGKRVLVVSQKRAALDVVYKRLKAAGLGNYAALVHDHQLDRNALYAQIRRQIEEIETFQAEIQRAQQQKLQEEYENTCSLADDFTQSFEDLHQALNTKLSCGLSAHELYLRSDSQSEKLAVGELATWVTQSDLNRFVVKLKTILDYQDFYNEAYIWKKRLSFHAYPQDEKTKILALLAQIPAQQQGFHELAKQLENLGKVLDSERRNAILTQYKEVEAIRKSAIYECISLVYKDNLTIHFISDSIEEIKNALEILEKRRYASKWTWDTACKVVEHVGYYAGQKNDLLKIFSPKFHQAKSFLTQIAQAHQQELNELVFAEIKADADAFVALFSWVGQVSAFAFFPPFPIHNHFGEGKNWLKESENRLEAFLCIDKWKVSNTEIEQLKKLDESLLIAENAWKNYLSPTQIQPLFAEIETGNFLWANSLAEVLKRDFEELKSLDTLIQQFTSEELACLEAVEKYFPIEAADAQKAFLKKLQNSFDLYWLEAAEQLFPVLNDVSTRGFARKQADFAEILKEKREKTGEVLNIKLKSRICGITDCGNVPINYRELLHQVSKKRKLWALRKLIQEFWGNGLADLIPCWMASPESVSAIFPMQADFFDLIVFDEASQCFVERAVPVILRGTQTLIAGDSKQLQPFDMYNVRYEETEEDFVETPIALEVQSALDLAQAHFPESKLSWHYRSQEEELINFSNQAFYEGRLQVIPPAESNPLYQPPLEWLTVQGIWKQNRNQAEAERVIDLILDWVQKPEQPSLGVVTFNFFQQELLRDLLDQKAERLLTENPPLYEQLQAARTRTRGEEFEGLFIKNIENVQGDERDIIIFSVGYAPDETGKLRAQFGLLNQQGGENRLNVAITRARNKVYVVCSFNPAELEVSSAKYRGPQLLKDYLQYVKSVSEGNKVLAEQILQQNQAAPSVNMPNPIADFLAEKLEAKGYFLLRNFGDTRYKLDLAVKKAADSKGFLLGIECEGAHYFSGADAKEREVFRRNLLSTRGWKVARVWARNFWMNKEKVWEEVEKMLGEG